MGIRRRVLAGARVGLVAVAVCVPLLVSPVASAVVPPPQFNCVPSQATSFSNATDVAIPDAIDANTPGIATSTINVAALTGKISDVDVLTTIPHADPGDLAITLTSPAGKKIELSVFNGVGAGNAFNGTTWDDDADPDGASTAATNNGLVTDHNYVAGSVATPLVPQEALAAFIGDDPNGVWTLTVGDSVVSDLGVIDSWSLAIATDESFPATGTATSFGPQLVIPDGGTVTSPLTVIGRNRRVRSLSVSFGVFSYTGLGDLTITLQSATGTTVTLTSRNGGLVYLAPRSRTWSLPTGPFTGFGTPDPITDIDFTQAFLPSSFAPEESFGAFIGEDPVGTWTLSATDAGQLPGGGTVGIWSLGIAGAECAGNAQLTGFTGPTAGSRVGDTITYVATAKSVGIGAAQNLSLLVLLEQRVRVVRADSGSGGVCTLRRSSSENTVFCQWTGPTLPGDSRSIRIAGEAIAVGAVAAKAEMRASAGATVASYGTGIVASARTGPVTILPSNTRAFNGRRCTVLGTDGADNFHTFPRGAGPHVLCGRGGNDFIDGGALGDTIDGGSGKDVLMGAGRSDQIGGGPGDDTLYGGAGADELRGGPGKDRLFGEAGRDRLFGGTGADLLAGGRGNDVGVKGLGDRLVSIEHAR